MLAIGLPANERSRAWRTDNRASAAAYGRRWMQRMKRRYLRLPAAGPGALRTTHWCHSVACRSLRWLGSWVAAMPRSALDGSSLASRCVGGVSPKLRPATRPAWLLGVRTGLSIGGLPLNE